MTPVNITPRLRSGFFPSFLAQLYRIGSETSPERGTIRPSSSSSGVVPWV